MNWHSFEAFLQMGGYGLYVWSSYGICLLAMVLEAGLARRRVRIARQAVIDDEETAA